MKQTDALFSHMNLKAGDNYSEEPVSFLCHSERLFGVIHKAINPVKFGVLIVVGGPQYRVGSHRQFVLLARVLAKKGISVMRFDYRGMGDSEGEIRSFNEIDDDIRAAVDNFYIYCPNLSGVIIWGLCDAASAVCFYGYQDERICGLVLLNPWVFTEQGSAKVYLKHYYLKRLLSKDFWKKVFTLRFDYLNSFLSLFKMINKSVNGFNQKNNSAVIGVSAKRNTDLVSKALPLSNRMQQCLTKFRHSILIILSGNDLTADEFKEMLKSDVSWQKLLRKKQVTRFNFDEADHTFSSGQWRDEVAKVTLEWVMKQ